METVQEPVKTWIKSVFDALQKLQTEYSVNRGMILTEGDLECHLFNKLLNEDSLKGFYNSKNDSFFNKKHAQLKTTYVHSQVTWFKPGAKSGFEVDLTIGNPDKLEVINIELFEKYTSKGYAYDGPCIAIELKFIRDIQRASSQGHEDFLKLRDNLIPSKLENIKEGRYKVSSQNNIAFFSIVGCKYKEIYEKVKFYIGKHLSDSDKPCPDNLFVTAFFQDELTTDKDEIKNFYEKKGQLITRGHKTLRG